MDRGSSLFSLCVFIYCIFQAARFSNGDENLCLCPEIPLVNLTETPPTTCLKIGQTYRYKCTTGYLREAGTSNLITCIEAGDQKGKWTPHSLKCIRDPRIKTREPTNPPLTTKTTNIDSTSTGVTTSSIVAVRGSGKSNVVTEAPPSIAEDHRAGFTSEPKYILPSSVALVCLVALVGGMVYIFCKRRTSTAAQPLPAEQIPMAKDPSGSSQ